MKRNTQFGRISGRLFAAAALSLAMTGFSATASDAATGNGPITSRLNKVLVYFFNYGSDHTNTPNYVRYVKELGDANGFTVDTTRQQAVFTSANLAQYDVIFLFSAYYFGRNMNTTQKSAVESWYAGNRGIACFHQCVRNEWGGTYPNWYDNLMGVRYTTYAGFGVGPVYVDSSVLGTDLAMDRDKNPYRADYTFNAGAGIRWDDEWYTYDGLQANLPNTKAILRTNRTGHSGSRNWNSVQPQTGITMAWAREVQGGRYVLSSFFHTNNPIAGKGGLSGTRPDSLANFIDGHYLGVLRYLAGYTGCTDSTSANYNPKATHNDPAVCAGTGIRVGRGGENFGHGLRRVSRADFQIAVTESGPHSIEVYDLKGHRLAAYRGNKPKTYRFPQLQTSGIYAVRAKLRSGSYSERVLLF